MCFSAVGDWSWSFPSKRRDLAVRLTEWTVVCVSVWVWECVSVCERERESERVRECESVREWERECVWCVCVTRSEAPNWTNWLAKCALKPRTEPIDSRNALWSPELNQLTRETRSEAPNWTNWLAKRALKPPNWTNWLAKRALKPRTEPIDSRNALWSPELNQLTREMRSEAPNWTNWLVKRALKPRTEPIDSRNALWSPELNQLTRETRSEAPNWTNWLNVMKRAVWQMWGVLCVKWWSVFLCSHGVQVNNAAMHEAMITSASGSLWSLVRVHTAWFSPADFIFGLAVPLSTSVHLWFCACEGWSWFLKGLWKLASWTHLKHKQTWTRTCWTSSVWGSWST